MKFHRFLNSRVLVGLSAGVLLGAAGGNVHAVTAMSQLFGNQLNQLSDNSGESQNVDADGDGFLDVGDTLRGTFQIGTVEDLSGGGGTRILGSGAVNELTGLFEITVASLTVTSDPDGSCGADPTCGGGAFSGDEEATYVFAPYAPFAAATGAAAGTMAILWDDPAQNYDRTLGAIAAIEAGATDGARVLEIGFGGDPDEFWVATDAAVDPSIGGSVAPGTAVADFNFALSILTNLSGRLFNQVLAGCAPGCPGDNFIDINGSGEALGTFGTSTAYDLFDNVDLTVRVVPEPATLGLMGLGFLALGGVARRRKARAQ